MIKSRNPITAPKIPIIPKVLNDPKDVNDLTYAKEIMFDEFLKYLRYELNRSPHTVEAYRRDLEQFVGWLTDDGARSFDAPSVTTGDIRAWIARRAAVDSAATLRRKTQSLRSYFRWLMRRKEVPTNPATDVVLAKKPRRLPEFVREQQMEDLLSIPTSEKGAQSASPSADNLYIETRDHLIVNILYSTGLRQAELLGLNDNDINFSSREAKVTGKRNKQRLIPMPEELLNEIRRWILLRDSIMPPQHPQPLFPGREGRISKMQLYRIVRDKLSATDSPAKSPHVLRHTFATSMLNHGANLDTVREMLGHASLSTTEIYTHLSFEQLREAYRTAHPRSTSAPEHTDDPDQNK